MWPLKVCGAFLNNTFTKAMTRKAHRCGMNLTNNAYMELRGIRQYALLNLVRMHYTRQEYTAARKVIHI
jgi:hypothetical protein